MADLRPETTADTVDNSPETMRARRGVQACDCPTLRNDGAGWYCGTHGNQPDTMADVTADTARHSDRVLERADGMLGMYSRRGTTAVPGTYSLIRSLMANLRYWRDAYHQEIRRLDQLAGDLETARRRADDAGGLALFDGVFEGWMAESTVAEIRFHGGPDLPDSPIVGQHVRVLADTDQTGGTA